MSFKFLQTVLLSGLLFSLLACTDAEDEKRLVDLHTIANLDVIEISFVAETEQTVSINSQVDFALQGLKSNGVDNVPISSGIEWSVSDGAASTINQQGQLSAAANSEDLTVFAKFGIYTESIAINVSSAKFDRVHELDMQASVEMCRSLSIRPVGLYIDENDEIETRTVDNTVINEIEWIILNKEDDSVSKRAFIETADNQLTLHTLAPGEITIQAKATSLDSGEVVTSEKFDHTISNGLNSIKLCLSSATNFASCEITVDDDEVEQDDSILYIAVGNYTTTSGTVNENISRNSKWGLTEPINASITFTDDFESIELTGIIENTDTALSVACGNVVQSLNDIQDLTQGMILDVALSCADSETCKVVSDSIDILELTVVSFEVTANKIDLTDDTSQVLTVKPAEITLEVTANLSNDRSRIITDDEDLVYFNFTTAIIEETNAPNVFKVLNAGTAKIELRFRDEKFIVLLEIPE